MPSYSAPSHECRFHFRADRAVVAAARAPRHASAALLGVYPRLRLLSRCLWPPPLSCRNLLIALSAHPLLTQNKHDAFIAMLASLPALRFLCIELSSALAARALYALAPPSRPCALTTFALTVERCAAASLVDALRRMAVLRVLRLCVKEMPGGDGVGMPAPDRLLAAQSAHDTTVSSEGVPEQVRAAAQSESKLGEIQAGEAAEVGEQAGLEADEGRACQMPLLTTVKELVLVGELPLRFERALVQVCSCEYAGGKPPIIGMCIGNSSLSLFAQPSCKKARPVRNHSQSTTPVAGGQNTGNIWSERIVLGEWTGGLRKARVVSSGSSLGESIPFP